MFENPTFGYEFYKLPNFMNCIYIIKYRNLENFEKYKIKILKIF